MQPIELLDLRRKAGLSQADLGKAIGYSRQAIIKWERNAVPIPQDVVPKLIAACLEQPAAPAPKNLKLIQHTVEAYTHMRSEGISHATIVRRWHESNFVPHPDAQAAILAAFPELKGPTQ